MGNAKERRKEFFQAHPLCCFCAGRRKAVEEEHIPPKIMFLNKHRPRGFEFPTCSECNRASRKTDEVVSFLAKFAAYRDNPNHLQSEFERPARAVLRSCPESYDELTGGTIGRRKQRKDFLIKYGVDVSISKVGAKQTQHLNLFAIKMTAAAFYKIEANFLQPSDKIVVRLLTQYSTLLDPRLRELDCLGPFSTLEMGAWRVPDQFSYRWAHDAKVETIAFEFVFHQNLRLVTFVFRNGEKTSCFNKSEQLFTIEDILPVDENPPAFPTVSGRYEFPQLRQ